LNFLEAPRSIEVELAGKLLRDQKPVHRLSGGGLRLMNREHRSGSPLNVASFDPILLVRDNFALGPAHRPAAFV
jgi:hypothetical protein